METKVRDGEYVAPEIDVVEIKSQGVLCESIFGNTEEYDNGIFDW